MWSSQRYLFFPIFLSYLWAGVGVVEIQERVTRRLNLSPQRVALGLFVLIFMVFLPVLLRPQRVEKLERKVIGLWIRSREIGVPLILTDSPRVAYYAGGDLLILDPGRYERDISRASQKGIDYIVVKEKDVAEKYPRLMELARDHFLLQKIPQTEGRKEGKYLVFGSRGRE